MKIQTARLLLRDYRPEDLDAYFGLHSQAQVWEQSQEKAISQKGEASKLLGDLISHQISSDVGYRALCLKDGTYIGEAGILQVEKDCSRCRLGCNLLSEYWGKGYAAEITQALLHLAFAMLKLERAEAYALSDNARACRAMEKAGLMKEGVLRHYHREGKNFRDVCLYAMIRQDWKE